MSCDLSSILGVAEPSCPHQCRFFPVHTMIYTAKARLRCAEFLSQRLPSNDSPSTLLASASFIPSMQVSSSGALRRAAGLNESASG